VIQGQRAGLLRKLLQDRIPREPRNLFPETVNILHIATTTTSTTTTIFSASSSLPYVAPDF
jgi:hypothetical protein